MIELRSESAVRERGEQLRAGYSGCPDCTRKLLLIDPLNDRIHPATSDARPLLLACELRPNVLAPHLAPREGDGNSSISYRCDWTRVVGWFAREQGAVTLR
jgi:hypothetical protein